MRRAPNFPQFMIIGGLIGVLLGLYVGQRGESGSYSDATAMGLLAVLFGAIGVMIATAIALALDKRSRRR